MNIRSTLILTLSFVAIGFFSYFTFVHFESGTRYPASNGIVLPSGLHISWDQINEIKNRLKTLEEDKVFFHWTTSENGLRWVSQGHINQGEVEFFNTPSSERQAHGAGFYLAESSTSSSHYGDFPVVVKISKGTPIYDSVVIEEVLEKTLNNSNDISALGAHINFVRNVTGDWWLTHNHSNTAKVEYGGRYGAHAKDLEINELSDFYKYLKKFSSNNTAQWLNSFYHLSYYMDGISLMRAIKVNPSNPWAEFEPENFEIFKEMREEYLDDTNRPKVRNNTWGQNDYSKESWIDKQVNEELKSFYQKINKTSDYHFRGHGIRAGGEESGQRFKATPLQLSNLLDNPLLDVSYELSEDKSHFLVSYEYPSVDRWQKVRHFLSEDLILAIESGSESNERLNQRMMEELLKDLFSSLYNNEINEADFLRRFISIHPFSDRNGRISRMFLERELKFRNRSLPPMFLSDLDLLLSKKSFSEVIKDSEKAYSSLYASFLVEFLSTGMGQKMGHYYDLDAWSDLSKSLDSLGMGDLKVSTEDYDDIRQRRFNDVFSGTGGKAWDFSVGTDGEKTIEIAKKYGATGYLDSIVDKARRIIAGINEANALEGDHLIEVQQFMDLISDFEGVKELRSLFNTKVEEIIVNRVDQHHSQIRLAKLLVMGMPFDEQEVVIARLLAPFEANATLKNNNNFYQFLSGARKSIDANRLVNKVAKGEANISELIEVAKRASRNKWDASFLNTKSFEKVFEMADYDQKHKLSLAVDWPNSIDINSAENFLRIFIDSIKESEEDSEGLNKYVLNNIGEVYRRFESNVKYEERIGRQHLRLVEGKPKVIYKILRERMTVHPYETFMDLALNSLYDFIRSDNPSANEDINTFVKVYIHFQENWNTLSGVSSDEFSIFLERLDSSYRKKILERLGVNFSKGPMFDGVLKFFDESSNEEEKQIIERKLFFTLSDLSPLTDVEASKQFYKVLPYIESPDLKLSLYLNILNKPFQRDDLATKQFLSEFKNLVTSSIDDLEDNKKLRDVFADNDSVIQNKLSPSDLFSKDEQIEKFIPHFSNSTKRSIATMLVNDADTVERLSEIKSIFDKLLSTKSLKTTWNEEFSNMVKDKVLEAIEKGDKSDDFILSAFKLMLDTNNNFNYYSTSIFNSISRSAELELRFLNKMKTIWFERSIEKIKNDEIKFTEVIAGNSWDTFVSLKLSSDQKRSLYQVLDGITVNEFESSMFGAGSKFDLNSDVVKVIFENIMKMEDGARKTRVSKAIIYKLRPSILAKYGEGMNSNVNEVKSDIKKILALGGANANNDFISEVRNVFMFLPMWDQLHSEFSGPLSSESCTDVLKQILGS
ncbi:Fic family protein [Halobacteriovorax sp. GFR7]|uniref:Fic family protein n=1 Tax=unclassified Halobacteriovorax TaxID=2639665 RepID=UPI003D951A6E